MLPRKPIVVVISLLLLFSMILGACAAPSAVAPAEEPATAEPAAESDAESATAPATDSEESMDDGIMAPLDPPEEVTVAYVPIMKFATMYVAEELGLFDKYGLDVNMEASSPVPRPSPS